MSNLVEIMIKSETNMVNILSLDVESVSEFLFVVSIVEKFNLKLGINI